MFLMEDMARVGAAVNPACKTQSGASFHQGKSNLILLQLILFFHPEHDFRHVGLQHHSPHHKLVQDKVNLPT